jgi:hypothetical protein
VLIALIGVVLIGVAAAIVWVFVNWERSGKEQLVPLVLLGMLVVEATLYSDPNALPRGLFHPGSGSTQLRLPEIYITLALVARLIARGRPTRIGLPAGLWLAFAAWMVVGVVEGKLYGNPFSQDIYEAKDILYIVGAYALAAGVPIRKYIDSGDLFKLGTLSVVCASVLDLMTIGHVSVNTTVPVLPLQAFGMVGAETAALFLAIVAMCFLVRVASGPVRFRHVLALIPVVGAVLLADQRAVIVNLAVVVLVVVVGVAVGPRHGIARKLYVSLGQVVLTLLALVAVTTAIVVVPAAVDRQPARDTSRFELPVPVPQRREGGIGPGPPGPGLGGGEADPAAPGHRVGARHRVPVLRSGDALGADDRLRAQSRPRPLAPARSHRARALPRRSGCFRHGGPPGVAATSRPGDGRAGPGFGRGRSRSLRNGAPRAPPRRIPICHAVRSQPRSAARLRHRHGRTAGPARLVPGGLRIEVRRRREELERARESRPRVGVAGMNAPALDCLVVWARREHVPAGLAWRIASQSDVESRVSSGCSGWPR